MTDLVFSNREIESMIKFIRVDYKDYSFFEDVADALEYLSSIGDLPEGQDSDDWLKLGLEVSIVSSPDSPYANAARTVIICLTKHCVIVKNPKENSLQKFLIFDREDLTRYESGGRKQVIRLISDPFSQNYFKEERKEEAKSDIKTACSNLAKIRSDDDDSQQKIDAAIQGIESSIAGYRTVVAQEIFDEDRCHSDE